ncbi:MAG: hypothetical protein Q9M36_04120 [Sulfurovum sp.]|nr:hypothetical protein [Sulfurovum sp.]
MYQNFRPIVLLLALNMTLFATTRSDVKILEATENIRYLSQKIVKNYFFSTSYPQQLMMQNTLDTEIEALGENFRIIAITSKDGDTKDILEFLSYNREQMLELFGQEHNFENASLMIDYGETLLEGVNSIAQAYEYPFSDEEALLIANKTLNTSYNAYSNIIWSCIQSSIAQSFKSYYNNR